MNFIPLTLQDGSEIIIANIITYYVPVSIQSVTHISIYIILIPKE